MQFKQDDKVVCTLTDTTVEVQFGPFLSAGGREAYLVKGLMEMGRSSVVWTEDLQPAPKFKEGQQVLNARDQVVELHAGPFPDNEGDPFWVVKVKSGVYDQAWEMHMVPVG